jgi:hypothetical protein
VKKSKKLLKDSIVGRRHTRARALQSLLEDKEVKLNEYVFYTRRRSGDGCFAPMIWCSQERGYQAPKIRFSSTLIEQWSKTEGLLNMRLIQRDVDYTLTSAELWRIQRRFGKVVCPPDSGMQGGVEWRCAYLLPVAVEKTIKGMFVFGQIPRKDYLRSEQFGRVLKRIGVASIG